MSSLPSFPERAGEPAGTNSRSPQPYGGTRYQNGVLASVGGGSNNAVTYTFTNSTTNPIRLVMFEELRDKINSERVRRGGTTTSISITNPIQKDTFNAIKNNLGFDGSSTVLGQAYDAGFINRDSSDARYISGYSYWYTDKGGTVYYQPVYSNPMPDPTASTFYGPAAPSVGITDRSITDKIYASDINSVITALQNAGAVCTCNCNYCSCNCNYCTCNCNYSCTCNCNY